MATSLNLPIKIPKGIEPSKYEKNIKHIGTRHGEKLYEVLVTKEEMLNAEDLGDYFRVPADNRDLNYNKYEIHGNEKIYEMQEYTSHNTQRLDVDGMIKLLIKMGEIEE